MSRVTINKIGQLSGHEGAIYTLERGVSDHLFFSGSSDHLVVEWNLKTMKVEKAVAKLPAKAFAIKYLPEQNSLLIGQSQGGVHVVNLEKKEEQRLLQLHTDYIFDIQHLASKGLIFVLSGDGAYSVLNDQDFELKAAAKVSSMKLRTTVFREDRNEVLLGFGDGTIRILDLDTLAEKQVLKGHMDDFSVNTLAFHPNGKYLFSGSRDAHLNIWDVADNYRLIDKLPAHMYAIYSIVFSPDHQYFATASRDKSFRIWNAETIKPIQQVDRSRYESHSHSVNKLLWSRHHNFLISTGDDGQIMVWSVENT